MATAVVLGGSVVGSILALQLARSGWRVRLVDGEFDAFCEPPAELAPRPGAPHTVQAHGFMSRTLHELGTRLPDVRDALADAGAPMVPLAGYAPPPMVDGGRPGDEQLAALRVRRVTLDRVVGGIVATEPGVERVHGRATALVHDGAAVPTVTGLVLDDGTALTGDVVIDSGGRRSAVTAWLDELGVSREERVDACAVRYYSRHFALTGDPGRLPNRGFAEIHEFPSFVHLLFLGDNDTATLALSVHDTDPVLKRARHPAAFTALAAANPAFAPWHACLEPISPVFALGSLNNRIRHLVRDGTPGVVGVVQVGDAQCMTNPTRGRGVSMGLASAGRLHDLLVAGLRGEDLAQAYDAWQRGPLAVYYRETVASDNQLDEQLRAAVFGQALPANAPIVEVPSDHAITSGDLDRAARQSPDLFRVLMRAIMLLDDDRDVASPAVADDVRRVLGQLGPPDPPPPRPTDGLHDRSVVASVLAAYA